MSKVYPEIPDRETWHPWNFDIILHVLKPLIIVSRYFGIFPHRMIQERLSEDFTVSSIRICSVVACTYGVTMFLIQFSSIVFAIVLNSGLTNIVTQILWFSSNYVSLTIMIYGRLKPHVLSQFSSKWSQNESGLYVPQERLIKFSRNCCKVYFTLCLISVTVQGVYSFKQPNYSTYILRYAVWIFGTRKNIPIWVYIAQSAIICFWHLWVWVGCSFLEIFSCVIAKSIVFALERIKSDVNGVGDQERIQSTDVLNPIVSPSWSVRISEKNDSGHVHNNAERIQHENEPKVTPNENGVSSPGKLSPLLRMVKSYQRLTALQNDVNDVMGPALFVDFAQLVIMICTVCYLSFEFSETIDFQSAISYGATAFAVITRLIIIVICLGEVYSAGLSTNSSFGNAISSGYFGPSICIPVLGHLNASVLTPICFSAWGFFSVTRGTLLATASLIATYLVVLVQS